MPQVGLETLGGRDRRDGPRNEVSRRRGPQRPSPRRTWRRWKKASPTSERHVENVQKTYGIPCVVSINRFNHDTQAELDLLKSRIANSAPSVLATHWGDAARARGAGAHRVDLCEQKSNFQFVYDEKDTLWDKVNKIAKKSTARAK